MLSWPATIVLTVKSAGLLCFVDSELILGTKALFTHGDRIPRCHLLGPFVPDGSGSAIKAHEWTHFFTLTPWILTASKSFGWLLFYAEFGLVLSLFFGWLTTCLLGIVLETVADIAAFCLAGFRRSRFQIMLAYRRAARQEGEQLDGFNALLSMLYYPPWRAFWIISLATLPGRRRLIRRRKAPHICKPGTSRGALIQRLRIWRADLKLKQFVAFTDRCSSA